MREENEPRIQTTEKNKNWKAKLREYKCHNRSERNAYNIRENRTFLDVANGRVKELLEPPITPVLLKF